MAGSKNKLGEATSYTSKKTGKKTWRIKVYYRDSKGKPHRPSASGFRNERDARKYGAQMVKDLEAEDGKDTGTTIGDALQNDLPRAAKLRGRGTTGSLKRLLQIDHLVCKPLVGLTPADLINYVDYAKEQECEGAHAKSAKFKALPREKRLVSHATIKRNVHALKKAVREACQRANLPYPWGHITLDLEKSKARDFLVGDKHVETLRQAAAYEYGDAPVNTLQEVFLMFVFSIETGMREGEVAMLTNELIVENGYVAHLPITKNGDSSRCLAEHQGTGDIVVAT